MHMHFHILILTKREVSATYKSSSFIHRIIINLAKVLHLVFFCIKSMNVA